jgi:hypothetical protein
MTQEQYIKQLEKLARFRGTIPKLTTKIREPEQFDIYYIEKENAAYIIEDIILNPNHTSTISWKPLSGTNLDTGISLLDLNKQYILQEQPMTLEEFETVRPEFIKWVNNTANDFYSILSYDLRYFSHWLLDVEWIPDTDRFFDSILTETRNVNGWALHSINWDDENNHNALEFWWINEEKTEISFGMLYAADRSIIHIKKEIA